MTARTYARVHYHHITEHVGTHNRVRNDTHWYLSVDKHTNKKEWLLNSVLRYEVENPVGVMDYWCRLTNGLISSSLHESLSWNSVCLLKGLTTLSDQESDDALTALNLVLAIQREAIRVLKTSPGIKTSCTNHYIIPAVSTEIRYIYS